VIRAMMDEGYVYSCRALLQSDGDHWTATFTKLVGGLEGYSGEGGGSSRPEAVCWAALYTLDCKRSIEESKNEKRCRVCGERYG